MSMIITIWIITAFTIFIGFFWLFLALKHRKDLRNYPKPTSYPTISVIIPAYNEEKTIRKCINSVLSLTYPKKIEVIVVNDGSKDKTKEIAEKFSKKGEIKLINQENKGKGAALNNGLKYVTGELVAVMDADSVVTKNILKTLVGHFDEKNVGAVVSSIKPIKKSNTLQKLQDGEYIISCLFRRLLSLTNMNYITPGVFSLFRTNAIKKVGGFDEKNITEDMEIALRLQSRGYEIRSSIVSITKTSLPDTMRKFYNQRIRWYRGLIQNTIKYKNMLFNKKYGYLGTFQLPINIVFPFIALVVIGFLFYVTALSFYHFFQYLYIVGLNPNYFGFSLERFFISFDWLVYIPWAIGLGFGIYILKLSYDIMKEKTHEKWYFVVFLLFYFTLVNLMWCAAVIKETFRSESKW